MSKVEVTCQQLGWSMTLLGGIKIFLPLVFSEDEIGWLM